MIITCHTIEAMGLINTHCTSCHAEWEYNEQAPHELYPPEWGRHKNSIIGMMCCDAARICGDWTRNEWAVAVKFRRNEMTEENEK